MKTSLVAVATLIGAVACGSDTTAPTVSVSLTLVRIAAASGQVVSGLAFDVEAAEARIDLSLVESFTVNLDGVEIHTPGSGWSSIDLTAAAISLDLRALPNEGAGDPIVLGTIEGLEPGECRVRLFVSGASISFTETISVGNFEFLASQDYGAELRIPSGEQTGLKAEGACTVPDGGGDVSLLFDEDATLGTIAATGSGKINVSPVIHVRTENGGV